MSTSQRLSDCWLQSFGRGPAGDGDTLRAQGATWKQRVRFAASVRNAFDCHYSAAEIGEDIPFCKIADLLRLLTPRNTGGPVIYLAPGMFGVGPGELLISRDYAGPGEIRILRYPDLNRIACSRRLVEDTVQSVIEQIPDGPEQPGLILAGLSYGAHVILEAACRLAETGRPISQVILLNSVAFAQREYLLGMDRRLRECRSLRHVQTALLWKFCLPNCTGLRKYSMSSPLLRRAIFNDSVKMRLTPRLRVRAMLEHKASRFPGDIYLLRPAQSVPDSDDGWSALCNQVHCISFPVLRNDFLRNPNRRLVTQELSRIVAQQAGPGHAAAPSENCGVARD